MWSEIKRIIDKHQRFVLTTHVNPDGDGIGSAIAMAELLGAMGKEALIMCDSPLPERFAFLDRHHLYREWDPSVEADVVIVLDTHKRDRLGQLLELIDRPGVVSVAIDHHPQVEESFEVAAIDPAASSVGAMVYSLFKENAEPLSLLAAEGIYTSLVCDTGRFSYSSTSRKAHKLADECLKIGVDPDQMHERLFAQVPFAYLQVLARALPRMASYFDGKILLQRIERVDYKNLDVDPNDLDFIHDLNKSVKGVHCAIVLRELDDHLVRISWRASRDMGIVAMAQKLGGGGHERAAGATMKGPMAEVERVVLELIAPNC